MTFEFIIACRTLSVTDIRQGLTDLLARVLQDNLNEFDADVVDQMIQFRHARDGEQLTDTSGATAWHVLIGFTLELPEETTSAKAVVQEFASELPDTPPIFHAVKFEDPLLQAELTKRAEEIFALEMKLRRVLSFIYLYAYQSREPFNLLRDEKVNPMGNPTPERMKAAGENQFFHLTFGNYATLNQRQGLQFNDLLEIIRNADTYEKFHEEFSRVPIEHEDDTELLAGLNKLMDSIEKMRNCVAHNRYPSRRESDNYENALPELHEMLDNYLSKWELYINEDMLWDVEARAAVRNTLENASWDNSTKTIILYDPSDDRIYETVKSLEALREYLEHVADRAFLVHVPYDEGPLFQCDAFGIVETALYEYEDRLAEFFSDAV